VGTSAFAKGFAEADLLLKGFAEAGVVGLLKGLIPL